MSLRLCQRKSNSRLLAAQETGYTLNSWYGKHHHEMRWWHQAHFALVGNAHGILLCLGSHQRSQTALRAVAAPGAAAAQRRLVSRDAPERHRLRRLPGLRGGAMAEDGRAGNDRAHAGGEGLVRRVLGWQHLLQQCLEPSPILDGPINDRPNAHGKAGMTVVCRSQTVSQNARPARSGSSRISSG